MWLFLVTPHGDPLRAGEHALAHTEGRVFALSDLHSTVELGRRAAATTIRDVKREWDVDCALYGLHVTLFVDPLVEGARTVTDVALHRTSRKAISDQNIRRADHTHNAGLVLCDSICRVLSCFLR